MNKLLFAAVAFAGLSLGVGCKMNKAEEVREERTDLVRTQQKANEKIADIRADAAKEKAEVDAKASEKIADQRENVAQERQDLAKAENDLNKEERKDAVDAMAAGTLTGTLKSTLGSQLTLRDSAGVDHKLDVKDTTLVTYHGQAVKLDDYKAGTEVRASFINDGDEKVAREVTILSPALVK